MTSELYLVNRRAPSTDKGYETFAFSNKDKAEGFRVALGIESPVIETTMDSGEIID